MKKFLGTTVFVLVTLFAGAQFTKSLVKGTLTEKITHTPIAGATVNLGNQQTLTDEDGRFIFTKISLGNYSLKVNSLGFSNYTQMVTIQQNETALAIELTPFSLFLEPLELKAVRAANRAPFAKTSVTKEEIAESNLGQDISFLLNQTPSMVVNSDAGNGVGYTAMRIRGTDATRINVTLNGIPYNDAESMGTYFVDLPDFASSVNSIQIQRGVGTSSNGAGAFGATINMSTNEFIEKAYAEANNSFGSFNTFKNTIKAGSGLLDGHFTVDARISHIISDGFIERAKSNLSSFYFSTAYLNKKSSIRLNIFTGKEKTYQAWYGVPENVLATDRRNNPAGTEKPGSPYENQTDNYTQTHYQLFFNHSFNTRWSFNTAVFLSRGKGYYEEYKAHQLYAVYSLPDILIGTDTISTTDLVRQRWLDNSFYGQIASFQYKQHNDELTIGGGWSAYNGKHYGKIIWMQTGIVDNAYRYYDLTAAKSDANLYAKWQHRFNENWLSFADLQYRHVTHTMHGFEGSPTLTVDRKFNFINPKIGITYIKNGWQSFVSYALAQKEPNRDDFQTGITRQPKPETLHDFELGIEKKQSNYQLGLNLYYMYYENQLVLTGQINDVGSYTRINIPSSYRLGIELQGGIGINHWLNLSGNLALSNNKLKSFTEYIDNYDTGDQTAVSHQNTTLAFSPSVIAGATIQIIPVHQVTLNFTSKYVGKQYMDNSEAANRKLNSFLVEDIRASWTIKKLLFSEWHIIAQVNNVFNKKYEPNGYTYNYIYNQSLNTENGYYPMAGRNILLGVNITL